MKLPIKHHPATPRVGNEAVLCWSVREPLKGRAVCAEDKQKECLFYLSFVYIFF